MRVPSRRAGHRERSAPAVLAAWALLACLVAGVPLLLAYLIGWPLTGVRLPHGVPHHPFTLHTLARAGAILAWLVWAQFTACVIVEIRAARAGGRPPFRVPGISGTRYLAHTLVAVAFTTTLTATLAPAALARPVAVATATGNGVSGSIGVGAHVPPVHAAHASLTATVPAQQRSAPQPRVAVGHGRLLDDPIASFAAGAVKYYVVQPPDGRHHDSLWDIAERYLGDGRRYREIYALNQGRLQPDGTELQQESLIRPGWLLALPPDASGPGLTEQIPTPGVSAPISASPPPAQQANGGAPSAGATHAYAMPNAATPGSANGAAGGSAATHTAPNSNSLAHPVGARPAPPREPAGAHPAADGSVLHSIADVLPYVALIGSPVLAAGLLTALTAASRRRRRDHPGDPAPAAPEPAVAEVERTIRAAAATDTVDLVDRSLRALRTACEQAGRTPPAVHGGRVDREAVTLTLVEPDLLAPEPWTASADGLHWRFERRVLASLSPSTAAHPSESPVPYPLLLCVGAMGDDQIMINLESAEGRCTAVTGPPRQRRAVLAAAAATLAASPWADQIRIEAFGVPPELTLLAPERLRVHPVLDGALSALEHDAAATGPHLVRLLIAENVHPVDRARLRALTARPDCSTTALLGTDQPIEGMSGFGVDPVGRLRGPGLPGELAAARLPDALASALGALFRAAAAPRPTHVSLRPSDAVLPDSLETAGGAPGVRACVLGPVQLAGVGPSDAARGPLFTEALVLLLFHRAGLPAPVFARALWPRGITPAARDRMLRDMRAWLGDGPDGSPRLATSTDGVVRLSDDVRSDWDEFQIAYRDADRVPADRPDLVDAALSRALGLVRGELLADRPPGRYSWLGFGTQETEVPAVVADAAYRLASVRLARGDTAGAQQAAEQGLLGAPDDERLVQIKLRGIAAEGDRARLESVMADLRVRAWHRYGETDLHPVTEAMAERLVQEMH